MKKNRSFWLLLCAMTLMVLPLQAKTYKMSINPYTVGTSGLYCYVWNSDNYSYGNESYREYYASECITIVKAEYDETTGWLTASFDTDATSLAVGWSSSQSASYLYWYDEDYYYSSNVVYGLTESSWFYHDNNDDRIKQTEYTSLVPDATNSFTINVTEAGTLGVKMMQTFDEWTTPLALTVTGPLNDADMEYFKRLSNLQKLDLSGAEITTLKNCSTLTRLREVILPVSLTEIGNYAFNGCNRLEKINLGNITKIGSYAFRYCYTLNNLSLDNVQTIGSYAFYCCVGLTSVSMPQCTSIGSDAFQDCSNLQQVVLSDNLKTIPSYCFENCSNLTDINFPASLTTIEYNAFYNVPLTNVVLPESVTSVGSNNFNKAVSITLPASLTTFSDGSSTWKDVYCYHVVPPSFSFASSSYVANMTLHVPAFSIVSYKNEGNWYKFGSIVALEGNIDNVVIDSKFSLYSTTGLAENTEMYVKTGGILVSEELDNKTLNLGLYEQNIGTDYSSDYNYVYDENGNYQHDENGNMVYKYTKTLNNTGVLYVKSPITASSVRFRFVARANRWNFISLPFDVNMKDIQTPNVKWVIREYSGQNRALGTGTTWQNVAADATLQAKKGYILYCEDSKYTYDHIVFPAANSTSQNTFASTDQQVSLTHYEAEFAQDQSWNLVGNPFPCMFDLSETDFTGPVTIYLPGANTYTAYSPLDDSYHFRPGEAFFVQAPDDVNAITFKAEGRKKEMTAEISFNEYYYYNYYYSPSRKGMAGDEGRKVFNFIVRGKDFSDRARVVFNEAAKKEYEVGRDAAKMLSADAEVPQVFVYDNNVQYAICERPLQNGEAMLGIAATAAGQYTLALNTADEEYMVTLTDTKTGVTTELDNNGYTFDAETGVDNSRFLIRFTRKTPTSAENVSVPCQITVKGHTVEITADQPAGMAVYTVDGKVISKLYGMNLRLTLTPGIYIAEIDGKARKLVVK